MRPQTWVSFRDGAVPADRRVGLAEAAATPSPSRYNVRPYHPTRARRDDGSRRGAGRAEVTR
jgi:hypothetical protein